MGSQCSQMEVPGQRTSTAAQPNLGDLMQTQKEGRSSNYISGMKIPKVTSTHHISDWKHKQSLYIKTILCILTHHISDWKHKQSVYIQTILCILTVNVWISFTLCSLRPSFDSSDCFLFWKKTIFKINCEILLMLKYLIGPCWFTSHSKDATKSRPFLSLQHHSYPKCK